ncbi:MAG TPA: glycosyltransferase family 39 protein [Bryobacteraceae bacterium]
MLETPSVQSERASKPALRSWVVPGILLAFSALYLSTTLLRAHEKLFWYDEIFTVLECRLSPAAEWQALTHAVDQNPPPFYLVTQASEWLFGGNEIGARMPEILAFWILSLCLFSYVRRIAGTAAGFTAMALPMLTGAYYYAYEARPHGLVLGFAGLCLICWRTANTSGRRRALWWTAFAACLFGALMMHCYALLLAVPFAIAEIVRSAMDKRIRIRVWLALVLPIIAACALYVPLYIGYRHAVAGTDFIATFPPSVRQLRGFYAFLLAPCLIVLLLLLVTVAIGHPRSAEDTGGNRGGRSMLEPAVLACGFLALPLFGIVLGKMVHGPFFGRYFLSAVVGVSILAALAIHGALRPRFRSGFAVFMAFALAVQAASLLHHRFISHVGELIIEPSSKLQLETCPPTSTFSNKLFQVAAAGTGPIVIANSLEYIHFLYYRPGLRQRLYPITQDCKTDDLCRLYANLQRWVHVAGNPEENDRQFIASHKRFWLYGQSPHWLLVFTRNDHVRITRLMRRGGHYLAQVERSDSNSPVSSRAQ